MNRNRGALLVVLALAAGPVLDVVSVVVGAVAYAFVGWRFLLSPGYRAATARRWRTIPQMEVMQEIVGGAAGIVLPILLGVTVWWGMRPPT